MSKSIFSAENLKAADLYYIQSFITTCLVLCIMVGGLLSSGSARAYDWPATSGQFNIKLDKRGYSLISGWVSQKNYGGTDSEYLVEYIELDTPQQFTARGQIVFDITVTGDVNSSQICRQVLDFGELGKNEKKVPVRNSTCRKIPPNEKESQIEVKVSGSIMLRTSGPNGGFGDKAAKKFFTNMNLAMAGHDYTGYLRAELDVDIPALESCEITLPVGVVHMGNIPISRIPQSHSGYLDEYENTLPVLYGCTSGERVLITVSSSGATEGECFKDSMGVLDYCLYWRLKPLKPGLGIYEKNYGSDVPSGMLLASYVTIKLLHRGAPPAIGKAHVNLFFTLQPD